MRLPWVSSEMGDPIVDVAYAVAKARKGETAQVKSVKGVRGRVAVKGVRGRVAVKGVVDR